MRLYTSLFFANTIFLLLAGCSQSSLYTDKYQTPQKVLDVAFERNLIVPVKIKGKTYNFLVDTGASLNVINKDLVPSITQKISLIDLPEIYRKNFRTIRGVSGIINNQDYLFVKPIPIKIGPQEVKDNDLWIALETNAFSQLLGVKIDGLIGIDTFRKFSWQVDNEKKRIVLTFDAPPAKEWEACTGYRDSYNSAPELWFTFGPNAISFSIDTGADSGYVSKEFIESYKDSKSLLNKENFGSMSQDMLGTHKADTYILKNLEFNSLSLGEISVSESSEKFAIGMEVLSRFKRYAFIPSRMMFCYDADSLEKHNISANRKISIRYFKNHIELFGNSSMELAPLSLRNGDILLKVNGLFFLPDQIDNVRDILRLTPKGKLFLLIKRGQDVFEINI